MITHRIQVQFTEWTAPYNAGEIATIEAEQAQRWIDQGYAIAVEGEPIAVEEEITEVSKKSKGK